MDTRNNSEHLIKLVIIVDKTMFFEHSLLSFFLWVVFRFDFKHSFCLISAGLFTLLLEEIGELFSLYFLFLGGEMGDPKYPLSSK